MGLLSVILRFIPAPYLILALVIGLAVSHGYAYIKGRHAEQSKAAAQVIALQQQSQQLQLELEQARGKVREVYRDKIVQIDRVVQDPQCLDRPYPAPAVDGLRDLQKHRP